MGTFHVACHIENPVRQARVARVSSLLVDTGSECTWIPGSTLKDIGGRRQKANDLEGGMSPWVCSRFRLS